MTAGSAPAGPEVTVERVLVAVDGSEPARRAAAHGIEIAARFGAAVEVVTVRPDADEPDRGRDHVAPVVERASARGVEATATLLDGRPAAAVARRATECGADLIAVGRQGRRGLGARLLGSVTERLLRRSDVPVLTVPRGAPTGEGEGDGDGDGDAAPYDGVLVTTDGSEAAAGAGPYGAAVADRFDAALHVLAVVDVLAEAGVFDAGGVDRAYVDRIENRLCGAVDDLIDGVDAAGLDVHPAVVHGTAHEAIGGYVDEHGIDLVAMGSAGQSNLAGQRLGTVTGRVLRTVDRPVLVVTD
jgi:nucleotide-binding universal stress UspA family protein